MDTEPKNEQAGQPEEGWLYENPQVTELAAIEDPQLLDRINAVKGLLQRATANPEIPSMLANAEIMRQMVEDQVQARYRHLLPPRGRGDTDDSGF